MYDRNIFHSAQNVTDVSFFCSVKCLPLAGSDPANEHDLDHVDKLDVLVLHAFDAGLESGQLRRFAQDRPFLSQEDSRMGAPDRNSGAAAQLALRGSVM